MVAVAQAADELKYPVVLKWRDPNLAGPRLSKHGLALEKAEYAQGRQQLLEICHRYEAVGIWPLIQEYCPGDRSGQFFFMHKGEALRRFQHIRIADGCPKVGFPACAIAFRCHGIRSFRSIQSRCFAPSGGRGLRWSNTDLTQRASGPS